MSALNNQQDYGSLGTSNEGIIDLTNVENSSSPTYMHYGPNANTDENYYRSNESSDLRRHQENSGVTMTSFRTMVSTNENNDTRANEARANQNILHDSDVEDNMFEEDNDFLPRHLRDPNLEYSSINSNDGENNNDVGFYSRKRNHYTTDRNEGSGHSEEENFLNSDNKIVRRKIDHTQIRVKLLDKSKFPENEGKTPCDDQFFIDSDESMSDDGIDEMACFNDAVNVGTVNYLLDSFATEYYQHQGDLFGKRNKTSLQIQENLSYSVIQGVGSRGFVLVGFPGSQDYVPDTKDLVYHKCFSVRFVLLSNCAIVFLSNFLHCGSRSRHIKNRLSCDPRFFAYIQKKDERDNSKRVLRKKSSVSPEGNRTPGPQKICSNLSNQNEVTCDTCAKLDWTGDKVIDIEKIFGEENIKKKRVGDHILGDLFCHGFHIFRCQAPNKVTSKFIKDTIFNPPVSVGYIGKQSHRKLLFPPQSNEFLLSPNFKDHPLYRHINKLFLVAKRYVLPKSIEYEIIKPNMIWNSGELPFDQDPHYDYPKINHVEE